VEKTLEMMLKASLLTPLVEGTVKKTKKIEWSQGDLNP